MDEKQLESLIESENLSLEEVQYLKSILMEVSATGTSKTLDAIWAQDYEEIPVSIDEFLTNDRYLGKSVKDDNGELTLYPFWQKATKEIFEPGNQYMEVALSGCLSGDTVVPLMNGTTISIRDMYKNPDKYEVYSFDDRVNEYTVGCVTDIMFTGVKPTYKITLDNGESVIATDDHKFLTRDKHWKSIKTGLEVGTSLMPFNRFIDEDGDEEAFTDLIANYNHKIVSIEYYDIIDVYDLTVDKYHNFALESGIVAHNCIGSGKTTEAVVCLCYILYKLLCLKNPANYYNLNRGSKIAIAFFNINIDQAYGVGYSRMQTYLKQSPWFLEHGTLIGRNNPTYYPDKNIEILVGSKSDHFIGRDVFAALLDELNFAPGQDMSLEKSNVLKLYNTIRRRIDSRFMRKGVIPGKLFLVSSKDDEYDFLEQYINRNKHNPKMYLVDEPIWVVKEGLGLYSGETFNVAIGDRYNKSRILSDNEDPEFISNQGQQVIKVPVEHREAFELDINTALADIAGVAIVSSSKFFVMSKVKASYRTYMRNPFKQDEIMLGFDDETQIKDFLIESLLPKMNRNKPHYIHWDASITGDRTGLSMLTYANTKQVRRLIKGEVSTVTDNVYKVVFAIAIKNVPGEEIPFFKIRNFIYYLRELGFNIANVSNDSFQSRDSIQQFKKQGFNAEMLSVDRSEEPYIALKNAINEGRVIMPYIKLLEDEFEDVEENKLKHKVDHTQQGCLLGETLILTNNGNKRITDLDVTDKIYAVDIESQEVIESEFCNLRETKQVTEYYEIETENGQIIKCTNNHLILTDRGYVRADELLESDEIIEVLDIPDKNPKEYKYNYLVRIQDILKYLYLDKGLPIRGVCEYFPNIGKTMVQTVIDNLGFIRNRSESNKNSLKWYPNRHNDLINNLNYDNSDHISRSSYELRYQEFLDNHNINYIYNYHIPGNRHPYDFYLIDYNKIVEIDGIYWHQNSQESDEFNTNYALVMDYSICRITDEQLDKYSTNLMNDITFTNKYDIISEIHDIDYVRECYNRSISRHTKPIKELDPNYKPGKMTNHWKYRSDISENDFKEFIGNNRDHTINDVYSHFNMSRNGVIRIVQQFYNESDFVLWQAKYIDSSDNQWKVRSLQYKLIDEGIIIRKDEHTKLEFISKYINGEIKEFNDMYQYLKRSRNYVLTWIEQVMEMEVSDFESTYFK